MSDRFTDDTFASQDNLIGDVADEFLECVRRGERPDVDAYAARYPQIADLLREMLPPLLALPSVNRAEVAPRAGQSTDDHADTPAAMFAKPLGDFRLIREIGRGGMGVVYEAEQLSLGRRVALKVLPFAAMLDRRHLERFKIEAQAAAQMHHTNIVPVFSVGCERGVYFYAMQYIDGHPLSEVIRSLRGEEAGQADDDATVSRDGWTTPNRSASWNISESRRLLSSAGDATRNPAYFRAVARLGVQAAEALEHAHERGVIHRDIKPSNLLLDSRGDVWLTDFGLAAYQSGGASLTATGDVLGTLRYCSPEQASPERGAVDHRADIYSLGMTLYELLTLQPAFAAQDRKHLLSAIMLTEPTSPRKINAAVPADLEAIVRMCIQKDARERYASARELADDLRRFVDQLPVLAKRPSVLRVARKWAARHRSLVGTAAAFVALALIGVSLAIFILTGKDQQIGEAKSLLQHRRDAELRAAAEAIENLGGSINAYLQTRTPAERIDAFSHLLLQYAQVNRRDTQTNMAMLCLAEAYAESHRPGEAEAYYRQALALARERGKNWELAETCRKSARFLQGRKQYEEAEQLAEEAVAQWTAAEGDFGPRDVALGDLVNIRMDMGKAAEAEEPAKQMLDARRQNWQGRPAFDAASVVGKVLVRQGKFEEAEPYLIEAYRGYRLTLSDARVIQPLRDAMGALVDLYEEWDHPESRAKIDMLMEDVPPWCRSLVAFDQGMYSLAESLMEDHLAVVAAEQPESLEHADWLGNLGATRAVLGKNEAAIDLIGHCVEIYARLKPNTTRHMRTTADLATLLESLGRYSEAEPHRRFLVAAKGRIAQDSPEQAEALAWLALNLLKQARFAEAEQAARGCLAIRDRLMPDDWLRFNAMSLLGQSFLGRQRFSEAEQLLVQACEGMAARKQAMPVDSTRLAEALEHLVRLYESRGGPGDAGKAGNYRALLQAEQERRAVTSEPTSDY